MALPPNLIIEKNKLDAKYPWLILLKFAIDEGGPGELIFRFIKNYKDVTFQGNLYKNFNFNLGIINSNIDGEIRETALSVSNVTHLLQADLEELNGAVDAVVTVILVHVDNLDEDYSELELIYDILSTHIGPLSIDFSIGAPSPLLQRFLTQIYFADMCTYDEFKGPRCGYVGAETICYRRLVDCRAYGNSARFGGCPGLRKDGVRFL